MRMRFAALLCACAVAAPVAALADPWVLAPGSYYSEFRGSYFEANTYRDADGERPPLGGVYESRGLQVYTELGWKKWASFHFTVPVESRTLTHASYHSLTSTGIADLTVGFKIKVMGGPSSALSLNADWQAPTGYNRRLTPALGEGVQIFNGALEYGTPLGAINGFLMASAGYSYKSETPDDVMFWSADLGTWMGSWLVTGQYRGSRVLEDKVEVEGDIAAHQAGPRFTYRLDDRVDFFFGSNHTVSGANVLHVDQFYAGVAVKDTKLHRLQGFFGGARRP